MTNKNPICICLLQVVLASIIAACSATPQTANCTAGNSTGAFPLRVRWCVKLDGPVIHPPRIQGGVVYVRVLNPSAAMFYAIDANSSQVLWTYTTDAARALESSWWDVVGNYLIISGGSGIESIDGNTGQSGWRRGVSTVQSITTDGKTVFLGSSGYAQAIDPATGETIWEYLGLPSHFTFRLYYDPSNNWLIIPADRMYVLDATSGKLLYLNDIQFPEGMTMSGTATYHGKLVFGNAVVDPTTGKVIYQISSGVNTGRPLINSDTLYHFVAYSGLASFDLKTQTQSWVYFAYDTTSTIREFLSNFAILDKNGYILTDDDVLRAVSLDTGQEVGQWSGPVSSYSLTPRAQLTYVPPVNVARSNEDLYVSFGTNLLYAFELR